MALRDVVKVSVANGAQATRTGRVPMSHAPVPGRHPRREAPARSSSSHLYLQVASPYGTNREAERRTQLVGVRCIPGGCGP